MKLINYKDQPGQSYPSDLAKGAVGRVVIGKADGDTSFCMRVFEIDPEGHSAKHSHEYEHQVFVHAGRGEAWDGENWHEIGPRQRDLHTGRKRTPTEERRFGQAGVRVRHPRRRAGDVKLVLPNPGNRLTGPPGLGNKPGRSLMNFSQGRSKSSISAKRLHGIPGTKAFDAETHHPKRICRPILGD